MITKGIVEEILSPSEVKVRIPVFDRANETSLSTKTEDLTVAAICGLPSCYNFVEVGDIVFVGFEDNTTYRAIVLGHLVTDKYREPSIRANLGSLSVSGMTCLSENTSIGSVTSHEISMLQGLSDNIQQQLSFIMERLDLLESSMSKED